MYEVPNFPQQAWQYASSYLKSTPLLNLNLCFDLTIWTTWDSGEAVGLSATDKEIYPTHWFREQLRLLGEALLSLGLINTLNTVPQQQNALLQRPFHLSHLLGLIINSSWRATSPHLIIPTNTSALCSAYSFALLGYMMLKSKRASH